MFADSEFIVIFTTDKTNNIMTQIILQDVYGKPLFRYTCEDNTYKRTLSEAIKRHYPLDRLLIVSQDLSSFNFDGLFASRAVFINCICSSSSFNNARLYGATFNSCELDSAVFTNAYLRTAVFQSCMLKCASFDNATLDNMVINDSILEYTSFISTKGYDTTVVHNCCRCSANIIDNSTYYPLACPSDGAFIGWKTVMLRDDNGHIVTEGPRYALIKLEIPEDANRTSADSTSHKCRCDKAKVLDIVVIDTGEHIKDITNIRLLDTYPVQIQKTVYTVGEMVYPDSFDSNRWQECTSGIHFFINRQEALNYIKH